MTNILKEKEQQQQEEEEDKKNKKKKNNEERGHDGDGDSAVVVAEGCDDEDVVVADQKNDEDVDEEQHIDEHEHDNDADNKQQDVDDVKNANENDSNRVASKDEKQEGTNDVEDDEDNNKNSSNNDDDDDDDEILWFREDERWELTWPIWHMLPWSERKLLAKKYGYEKIGDFEEYMTMQRALVLADDNDVNNIETSSRRSKKKKPYPNHLMYSTSTTTTATTNMSLSIANETNTTTSSVVAEDSAVDVDDEEPNVPFDKTAAVPPATADTTFAVNHNNKFPLSSSASSSSDDTSVTTAVLTEKKKAVVKEDVKNMVDDDTIDDERGNHHDEEDDDNENENVDDVLAERRDVASTTATTIDRCNHIELLKVGGQILMLPDEMLHRIFDWLYVDIYATLALVSPHWKSFTRTESVYKHLCQRLYLNQSKRKQLNVSKFNNSYHNMLLRRPRIRAGGGLYIMKYSRVKRIQRDMWTEIPIGAVLELTYYRYLYFQEDGRVLYALTSSPPHEMIRRIRNVCLYHLENNNDNSNDGNNNNNNKKESSSSSSLVWGRYQVQRTKVTVTAKQPWQYVKLVLSIQVHNRIHGRYGLLSFDGHVTSSKPLDNDDDHHLKDHDEYNNNKYDPHRVVYDVPDEPFRFLKDKRL